VDDEWNINTWLEEKLIQNLRGRELMEKVHTDRRILINSLLGI
jgi:hypothetical protein